MHRLVRSTKVATADLPALPITRSLPSDQAPRARRPRNAINSPAQGRGRLGVDPLISRANQPAIDAGDQPRRNNDHTLDRVRADRSTAITFGHDRPATAPFSADTAR